MILPVDYEFLRPWPAGDSTATAGLNSSRGKSRIREKETAENE